MYDTDIMIYNKYDLVFVAHGAPKILGIFYDEGKEDVFCNVDEVSLESTLGWGLLTR